MLSYDGGILLLREMMTMLRSRDVIQWTSFILMYDTYSCVSNYSCIKKALLFDSPLCVCVIVIHNRLKFTSQLMASHGWMVRSLTWRLSQPGFDPNYGKLMSSHTDEFW